MDERWSKTRNGVKRHDVVVSNVRTRSVCVADVDHGKEPSQRLHWHGKDLVIDGRRFQTTNMTSTEEEEASVSAVAFSETIGAVQDLEVSESGRVLVHTKASLSIDDGETALAGSFAASPLASPTASPKITEASDLSNLQRRIWVVTTAGAFCRWTFDTLSSLVHSRKHLSHHHSLPYSFQDCLGELEPLSIHCCAHSGSPRDGLTISLPS
jgi:hypothetical protein